MISANKGVGREDQISTLPKLLSPLALSDGLAICETGVSDNNAIVLDVYEHARADSPVQTQQR